jgi:hypothetical protein
MMAFFTLNRIKDIGLKNGCDHELIRKFIDHSLFGFLSQRSFLLIRNKDCAEVAWPFVAELSLGIEWINM